MQVTNKLADVLVLFCPAYGCTGADVCLSTAMKGDLINSHLNTSNWTTSTLGTAFVVC